MRSGVLKALIFIFMIHSVALAIGKAEKYEVIRDLRLDWEFYSDEDQGFLPYIAGNNIMTNAIYFHLPLERYKNKYMIISFQPGASLWINERLVGYYPKSKIIWYSIDSMLRSHVKDTVLVSVYDPSSSFDELITVIGVRAPVAVNAKTVNEIFMREIDENKDSFIIIAFIIIAFFTFWYNVFPIDFKFFFSLSSVFHRHTNSGSITSSLVISKPQLIFIYGLSLVIAFLLVVHQFVEEVSVLKWFLAEKPVFWGWFLLSMIVFVVLMLKYVLIIVLSSLFGISDLANYYFLGIMVLSMIFYMILFVILVVSGLSTYHNAGEIVRFLTYPIIFFYPIRLVFMFFALRRNTTVNNLHLFSYLCATELIPIIFGLKYLFH